jgi:vancomycin resistance protein YoaR
MSGFGVTHKRKTSFSTAFLQLVAALAGGLTLFLGLVIVWLLAFSLIYAHRIYPGVSVAGIDLSGLRPEEASVFLAQRITFPHTGKIAFRDGDRVWVVTPADLGLSLDPVANSVLAYNLGRAGNPFKRLNDQAAALYSGKNLAPLLNYDEGIAYRYISQLAAQVDKPTVEASLSVNDLDVVVIPGQVGRTVDIAATLASLSKQMSSLNDVLIQLPIEELTPTIMDASQQAEIARRILSAPLTLQTPDAKPGDLGPWVLPPDQLAKMLTIQRVESAEGWRYQVALDEQTLYDYVNNLVPDINRQAANARFIFNDTSNLLELIQPAVIGRNLDVYNTIKDINQKVVDGQHTLPLTIQYIQPDVGDDATGEKLGITEKIVSYTSYFRGSTTARLHNIETAAANFHGLLVPPGAIFSMASAMGNVTLDNGYSEAWIIFGGRTIKGVGGGVCQVSTTLFRAAFYAGFPIVERYPHAYRVSYYEQTARGEDENLAGLDATVFVPAIDFKFKNDTPYWLLMETYYNPSARSLTWKFYSTSDGRTVEWDTTGPQNLVDPDDPIYEENPDLSKGDIIQVDWAAVGADVIVTRTVYRDGVVLFGDTFVTHYLPWQDVYQFGPGTELPKKVFRRR